MYELLCMQRLGNCVICRIISIGISTSIRIIVFIMIITKFRLQNLDFHYKIQIHIILMWYFFRQTLGLLGSSPGLHLEMQRDQPGGEVDDVGVADEGQDDVNHDDNDGDGVGDEVTDPFYDDGDITGGWESPCVSGPAWVD